MIKPILQQNEQNTPILSEDADDTLFRKIRYSSHHLLHTLLPEQTTHPYHLRSIEPTALNSPLSMMNEILLTECCLKMPTQSVLNRSQSRQHP